MSHRPDPITSKDAGGTTYKAHSEGTHAMLCVDVVDLGYRLVQFPGQDAKEVHKIALVFASGEQNEDGSLILVTAEFTNSMNERANLRHFLESWRGKSYTAKQAEAGVPLHKLHGHAALLTVEHKRTKRDRIFANVRSVSPLPKGMASPNGTILGDYQRPTFLEDRKAQYADELAKYRASVRAEDPQYPDDYDQSPTGDDDLPY